MRDNYFKMIAVMGVSIFAELSIYEFIIYI